MGRPKKYSQILKIVKFLEENPNTYLREISRSLNISSSTVHRCLKEISEFLITKSVADGVGSLELPNLPIMIRLKQGVNAEGIIRFLRMKEKIENIKKK
ncbi:MAG: winged helix-turn-helix domain-containing protein [Candidatus Aenigmarchaeota archaeon]|nr:winged helix-turn-helix domain-containing protein [Candidatus Aenigmarchaeota archaeon]